MANATLIKSRQQFREQLMLRRKWTFTAHGSPFVLIKKVNERTSHVLMKAFIWALYLPEFPAMQIETGIGVRYKPDLVQVDSAGTPVFWAEAGHVGRRKFTYLVKRFKDAHLVFAQWASGAALFAKEMARLKKSMHRTGPIDWIGFPPDSAERFIDNEGAIQISLCDLNHQRY